MERKIATYLTPKVKEFVKEKWKTDFYDSYTEKRIFHYPNTHNFKGFLIGNHVYSDLGYDYTLVSEQEFLDYFNKSWDKYKDADTDVKMIFEKPIHYSQTKSGMDVFDVARDWSIKDPELFSALKYILRCGKKDSATSEITKAINCLNKYLKVLEDESK